MVNLAQLENYSDDLGNEITYTGPAPSKSQIQFRGANNKLTVAPNAKIGRLTVWFDCDNGAVEIGGHPNTSGLSMFIRVGQDSKVIIGENVSTTSACMVSALEGTSVTIGDDVMIASENEIKTDDAHPIFDIHTGERVNPSKSVIIGNHVWIAKRAVILSGATVGDGSVIGYGSLLKGHVPNNSIAAGVPAKVIRRDIAWERPHLSLAKPYYKPDASTVRKSEYWEPTETLDSLALSLSDERI